MCLGKKKAIQNENISRNLSFLRPDRADLGLCLVEKKVRKRGDLRSVQRNLFFSNETTGEQEQKIVVLSRHRPI